MSTLIEGCSFEWFCFLIKFYNSDLVFFYGLFLFLYGLNSGLPSSPSLFICAKFLIEFILELKVEFIFEVILELIFVLTCLYFVRVVLLLISSESSNNVSSFYFKGVYCFGEWYIDIG